MKTLLFEDELLEIFVHYFYEHGNFHGQSRFIGMQEGGGKSYQEVSQRLLTWSARGKLELEDVADFHRWIGITDLFSDDPKNQPTWGRLIRLLHISKYKHTQVEEIKEYQRDYLGRLHPVRSSPGLRSVLIPRPLAPGRCPNESPTPREISIQLY